MGARVPVRPVLGYHGGDMVRILAAEALFSLAILALQLVPRGAGWMTLIGVALLAAALPLLLAQARARREPPSSAAMKTMVAGAVVFAVAQRAFAIVRTVRPKVIDIAATTLAAVIATAHGENPYALPLDPLAGGIAVSGALFLGYKYLPAMIAAYAPLGLAFGMRGIVVTNVILQGACAAAIFALAARRRGAAAGLAGAVLYLSLPFPAHQLFTRGVNDLVAVVPLLLALLVLERRPGWAGLLVGLSIAAKLMPGLAVLPCLLPAAEGRRNYVLGVLAGLLPILPFALWAPDSFGANILLFNALRPVDDTSWLLGLPELAVTLARAAGAIALLSLYTRVWRRTPDPDERCVAAVLAILIVFAVGPDMHHNYYLWFIPFLAVLAGRGHLRLS